MTGVARPASAMAAKPPWPAARSSATFRRRSTGCRLEARLRVTLTGESARTLGRAEALALAERLEREIHREELLLELEWRAIDEGTAAHEMIHLLAANSGLLPRHDAFPVWLQEGIAMQFEVIRGGRWAGIGRANDLRLPDWRRIQPSPRLEPLVRDQGFGRGYQRDLYAQSWSLVFFLRSRHPSRFLTFLDLLRSADDALWELAPADRWLAVFQRASGRISLPWSTTGLNSCPPSKPRWNATHPPRRTGPPGRSPPVPASRDRSRSRNQK